jgi:hypothetical protein
MQESNTPPSRKKFLRWGAAALTSLTAFRFFNRTKKNMATDTVKMLTQDGKLVEVDRKLLGPAGKKISNTELQQWVKNNPAQPKNQ